MPNNIHFYCAMKSSMADTIYIPVDEAVWISCGVNAMGKVMNQTIISPAMGK